MIKKHAIVSLAGSPLALSWRRKVASYCSGSGWQKCVGMASAQAWASGCSTPPTRERDANLGRSQQRLDLLRSRSAVRSPLPKWYLKRKVDKIVCLLYVCGLLLKNCVAYWLIASSYLFLSSGFIPLRLSLDGLPLCLCHCLSTVCSFPFHFNH